jgi:hypothetical protein
MTTQHDCGGPVFGRKIPGCPRCDELLAGAPPVKWRRPLYDGGTQPHSRRDCIDYRCGPVCTAGDW